MVECPHSKCTQLPLLIVYSGSITTLHNYIHFRKVPHKHTCTCIYMYIVMHVLTIALQVQSGNHTGFLGQGCVTYFFSDSNRSVFDLSIHDKEIVLWTEHVNLDVIDLNKRICHQYKVILGPGNPQRFDDVTVVANGWMKDDTSCHLTGWVQYEKLAVLETTHNQVVLVAGVVTHGEDCEWN